MWTTSLNHSSDKKTCKWSLVSRCPRSPASFPRVYSHSPCLRTTWGSYFVPTPDTVGAVETQEEVGRRRRDGGEGQDMRSVKNTLERGPNHRGNRETFSGRYLSCNLPRYETPPASFPILFENSTIAPGFRRFGSSEIRVVQAGSNDRQILVQCTSLAAMEIERWPRIPNKTRRFFSSIGSGGRRIHRAVNPSYRLKCNKGLWRYAAHLG